MATEQAPPPDAAEPAIVEGRFDEPATEAEPVPIGRCRHCKGAAVICEAHAAQAVAQAFSEETENKRESATRAAERKLRQGGQGATYKDDATALRHVLVRWWGDEAIDVAREIVRVLETEK